MAKRSPTDGMTEINFFDQPVTVKKEALNTNSHYRRQYFAWLASEVNKRKGSHESIEDLNKAIEELSRLANATDDRELKASMLRFTLRLARKSGLSALVKELTLCLSELYASVSNEMPEPEPEKSLLAGWAVRYKSDKETPNLAERNMSSEVWHGLNTHSDLISMGNWGFYGLTHSGRANPAGEAQGKNDDAFLLLERDDNCLLLAVADGTGDSIDGARASQVVLGALAYAWKSNDNIAKAVTKSALALQEDNRKTLLDGASTLVALGLNRDDAEVINFGDTRYYLIARDGAEKKANVDLLSRGILGGEPLGDIITSGGNLVPEIRECSPDVVVSASDLVKIVLVSDGAFFLDNPEDNFDEIKDILNQHSTAEQAAQHILQRSLDAFRLGETKVDNVTVLVGIRNT